MEPEPLHLPKGLICPVISPLKPDGSLDTDSFRRLINHVAPFVGGFLLCDPEWGEAIQLPEETRFELVATALDLLQGSHPVLITVTGTTEEATCRILEKVETLCRETNDRSLRFWVDIPLVYHGNRDLPDLYLEMSSRTHTPFLVGNRPDFVRSHRPPGHRHNIRTAVLKKISRNPGVQGLIVEGGIKRSLYYQEAVRHRKDFRLYDGDEAVFLDNPGTSGVVAGGANLLPRIWQDVTRSSLNRYDFERQYTSHQRVIWHSGAMLHELNAICRPAPAACMKILLSRVGIISNPTAFTEPVLPAGWENEVERFMRKYDIL